MVILTEPMTTHGRSRKRRFLLAIGIFLGHEGAFAPSSVCVAQPLPAGSSIFVIGTGNGATGGFSFYSTFGTGYSDSYYYYPPLTGVYARIDPNLVIYPPTDRRLIPKSPPTAADLLAAGHAAKAIDLLQSELSSNPDDPERLRLLAVGLAENHDFDAAARILLGVYQRDPAISYYPLDGESVFGSPRALRQLVLGAVRRVQREQSPQGWLLVAVLMQAQGREEMAKKMIGRAEAIGLHRSIVDVWPAVSRP